MKYNSSRFDYNQNFKNFERKISLIKSEISELDKNKIQLEENIKNLTKKNINYKKEIILMKQ